MINSFGILEQAIQGALLARSNAILVKPSATKVGACVWTTEGKLYWGWNIQNKIQKSYHAEEIACIHAMLNLVPGEDIAGITVSFSDTDISRLTFCCGSCRQILWEFSKNPELPIYEVNLEGKIVKMVKLKELYPYPYPRYEGN